MSSELLGIIAGLVGTILGWGLSYCSTINKEEKDLFKKNCASLKQAYLILKWQLNILGGLQKHIDSCQNNDAQIEKWQKIKIYFRSFELIKLKTEDLFFLLDENENLLNDISCSDRSYQSVISLNDERNKLYKHYEEKTENIPEENRNEIFHTMGQRLYGKLSNITNMLIRENLDAIKAHKFSLKRIDKYIKSIEKFFR